MRLIDADELLKRYDETHDGPPGRARKLIEDAPTIDNQKPVEPKMTQAPYTFIHCGCCNEIISIDDKYCSNCGRRVKWDA